jgi:hypothetical protein
MRIRKEAQEECISISTRTLVTLNKTVRNKLRTYTTGDGKKLYFLLNYRELAETNTGHRFLLLLKLTVIWHANIQGHQIASSYIKYSTALPLDLRDRSTARTGTHYNIVPYCNAPTTHGSDFWTKDQSHITLPDSVEEPGLAEHGVAHPPQVPTLERAPDAFEHGDSRCRPVVRRGYWRSLASRSPGWPGRRQHAPVATAAEAEAVAAAMVALRRSSIPITLLEVVYIKNINHE